MSEDVYAIPDLTKKVRNGRGEREQEMEERGEREERIVDIYVTADDLYPGTQQDAVQKNTAQEQNEGSDQSKNNHSRAAALCLVLLSLLLVVIIGLVIKYSELNTEKNNLQSRYMNVTEQKDQIQSRFDQLQSNYTNAAKERQDLKKRLCERYEFTFDDGVCYYISTERKTWEESRQYCRDRQSDLLVINSKEKQDLVKRVAGRDVNTWLGLTDRDEEEVWKWVDGTTLTTPTYWVHGEPDNKFRQEVEDGDCAVLWNGRVKGWYDNPCSQANLWICERVLC